MEGFEEDFEPPQMVIQSPSPNKSPPNKSDNNNFKPDEIVKDKDVKKQDNNNENSDEETLKTPENNNKKQPDLSIGLVKQQQENKENIEDLLERIEEIFETGGEAGEETTKKRYKCPICSSTFSHRRYLFFGFFLKIHILWEGHKILSNIHLTFVLYSAGQK